MTERDLVLEWARAFALTVVVELTVAVPLLGRHMGSLSRRFALVSFAQFVTHPCVWFVFPALHWSWAAYAVAAELWAWLAEAAFYALTIPPLSGRRALGIALAANGTSVTVGLVLRTLGVNV